MVNRVISTQPSVSNIVVDTNEEILWRMLYYAHKLSALSEWSVLAKDIRDYKPTHFVARKNYFILGKHGGS